MRYQLTLDALQLLDIGKSVQPVQLNPGDLGLPPALDGSVVDCLYRWYPKLRTVAQDCLMAQHSLLFPYEDGTEARERPRSTVKRPMLSHCTRRHLTRQSLEVR
jgi:hypothetical protein